MDFFYMFGGGYDDYGYNRYAGRPDKSEAAKRREKEVQDKFNFLKAQMAVACWENTMTMLALGRKDASESCLRHLSDDMFAQVLDFAGVKKPSGSSVKLFASRRPTDTNEIIPFAGYSARAQRAKNPPTMNLADSTLFVAGAKISIEMSQPNLHITGPCWSTLLKHAKKNGWTLKRVAATSEEKKAYGQTRKGQVYFINAVYSVPVTKYPGKKPLYLKPPGGKKSGSKKRKSSSGGGQKKPAAKKRAVPAEPGESKAPPASGDGAPRSASGSRIETVVVPPGGRQLGLAVEILTRGGARVTKVDPSCEFRDRIVPGDVLVTVNGNPVRTAGDITEGSGGSRRLEFAVSTDKSAVGKKPPADNQPRSSDVVNVADLVPKDRQEHGAASDVNLRVLAATMLTDKVADVAQHDDDLKMSGTNKILKSDK